jgi:hypothetical protein
MAFDLNVWKDRATERLRGLGSFVTRTASGTPYAVYAGLCTLSLWPLVEVAQQGELLPVMTTLSDVAGRAKGNPIAMQIPAWSAMPAADAQAAMAA